MFFLLSFAFAQESHVRFVVMGDTGEACTSADPACLDGVAKSALAACTAANPVPCSFGLLLGDNFYETGVRGVKGPIWRKAFHRPFAGFAALPGFRFWAVPGNHDALTPGSIDAEIAHTTSPANTDGLWRMLPLPYTVDVPTDAASWLHLTGIDSNPLVNGGTLTLAPPSGTGGGSGWNLLFAHHLLVSDAEHGQRDAQQRTRLDAALAPYLGAGHAQMLISGHDHVQQVLVHPTRKIVQVVEGNSSRSRALCANPDRAGWTSLWATGEPGDGCKPGPDGPRTTGFMILDATPTTMGVHAYDWKGCELHRDTFTLATDGTVDVAASATAEPGKCL